MQILILMLSQQRQFCESKKESETPDSECWFYFLCCLNKYKLSENKTLDYECWYLYLCFLNKGWLWITIKESETHGSECWFSFFCFLNKDKLWDRGKKIKLSTLNANFHACVVPTKTVMWKWKRKWNSRFWILIFILVLFQQRQVV